MRLLHVSDLHLGRGLGDLSREAEQRAVVAEMIAAAEEHQVALTLVSGDVFDAYTPPAWAEDLFFELLDGLAGGGRRAVAVIAGNHDSGLRVAAADPLARRLGILLAGDAGEPIRGHEAGSNEVRVVPLAPQVARIEVPGAGAPIVAGLFPFLSEGKVARLLDEEGRAPFTTRYADVSRYTEHLARELAARAAHRDPKAVSVLALHQFVAGAAPSDSERRLRLAALADLDAAMIPAGLDYVALGHIHRPQVVEGSPSLALYAGSPMAYSFSEAGQKKRAVLVDVEPGRAARVRDIPLLGGRPLEVWSVESLDEARARAEKVSPASRSPIVELRIDLGRALLPSDGEVLFNLPGVTVLTVRDLHAETPRGPSSLGSIGVEELEPAREDLSVERLFRDLFVKKHDAEPDEETMRELTSALLELGRDVEPAPAVEVSPEETEFSPLPPSVAPTREVPE